MGLLEDMFGGASCLHSQQMAMQQNIMSPFAQELTGGLGGALTGNVPINRQVDTNDVPKSLYKPVLTFLQTLRNEIDEWLTI